MNNTFEDLLVRQQGKEITLSIYNDLKDSKDYGFKDQIQRASVSIMNNIAEGYDRFGGADKKKFFTIAKSSCAEVRSMVILGLELGYIPNNKKEFYNYKLFGLSKMIFSLIKKTN